MMCSQKLLCLQKFVALTFGIEKYHCFARTTNVVVQKMRSCRHKVKRMLCVDADEETALG